VNEEILGGQDGAAQGLVEGDITEHQGYQTVVERLLNRLQCQRSDDAAASTDGGRRLQTEHGDAGFGKAPGDETVQLEGSSTDPGKTMPALGGPDTIAGPVLASFPVSE